MTERLLPLHGRIAILLRSRRRPLFILALVAAAAFALDRSSGNLDGPFARLVVVIGIPLALTTVGTDLRNGMATLWVQKPVDPARFYLARFAEGAATSVALSLVCVCIVTAMALRLGWEPVARPMLTLVPAAFLSLVIASAGFGLSVTLPGFGRLGTVALVGFTMALELMSLLDPSLPDESWFPFARGVLLPWQALVELRGPGGMEPGRDLLLPLFRVLCYATVWIGVGAFGIRRAVAAGSWSRSV